MDAFLISFGIIFVAELGDKSQLMAMTFAARYRAVTILIAITAATALVHLFSVLLGAALGVALPTRAISIVAGFAFLGFAAWTLRGDELDDDDRSRAEQSTKSVLLTVGLAFFLAELGDKTMLATVTLATTNGLVGTWLGSTLGMVAADALAIVVGQQLGARLPERVVRIGAADHVRRVRAHPDRLRSSVVSQDGFMDFAERVAIVTGGASGMGAATARRLASGGAHVVIVDRNADLARTVAAEIRGTPAVGDVADSSFCDRVVGDAVGVHGQLDVLVNAAGVIVRASGRGHHRRTVGEDHGSQRQRNLLHVPGRAPCDEVGRKRSHRQLRLDLG